MGTSPGVPLRYSTRSIEELAKDMERAAVALTTWAKGLPSPTDALPIIGPLAATGATLAFGQTARVSPREGEQITLFLPRPDSRNGGRTVGVMRLAALGAVEIVATDCTVNGLEHIYLLGDVGLTSIQFDGGDYFMSNAGSLPWGDGL